MQLLTDLIVSVLLLMIKIGDIVLLIIEWLIGKLKKLSIYIINLFLKLGKFNYQKLIFRPKIASSLKSNIKPKYLKKRKIRGHPKIKSITVYPQSFFVKIKYFIAGGLFTLIIIGVPLSLYVFIQSLPNPSQLSTNQIPLTTKIYDRNHTLLYQFYANQNRTNISLSQVPIYLKEGTIAIEDKDFYTHPGFDITAIIRSFIDDLRGQQLQGGSTITQQLIKSALLTPQTSITRKLKEVVLAFWAERIYSKNQILEMYFNYVPYGGTAWGVEAASEMYFGKSVSDLDLAQSAFLAGLPQAPTDYSPYGPTPNLWKERQKAVLLRMEELGYITKTQENDALAEQLQFQSPQTPILAPHFVWYVKDLLVQKYGLPIV